MDIFLWHHNACFIIDLLKLKKNNLQKKFKFAFDKKLQTKIRDSTGCYNRILHEFKTDPSTKIIWHLSLLQENKAITTSIACVASVTKREQKNRRSRGWSICAWPECKKALCTRTFAMQATTSNVCLLQLADISICVLSDPPWKNDYISQGGGEWEEMTLS